MKTASLIVDIVFFITLTCIVIMYIFYLKELEYAIFGSFVAGMYAQNLINAFWDWLKKDNLY